MGKILHAWNWVEGQITGILAFIGTVIVLYAVFMRYFMANAPEWTEEVVSYLFIMAFYISASTLTEERGHIGATFIVEKIPEKYRRWIEVVNGCLALGFCLLVAYLGFRIVKVAWLMGEKSESSVRFPMWVPYLSVPLGMSLIFLRYVRRLYRLLFSFAPEDLNERHELSRSRQE
jgi:C4-dicarboxylate transporter DctQ subunit